MISILPPPFGQRRTSTPKARRISTDHSRRRGLVMSSPSVTGSAVGTASFEVHGGGEGCTRAAAPGSVVDGTASGWRTFTPGDDAEFGTGWSRMPRPVRACRPRA
jgi:hypothetical protein